MFCVVGYHGKYVNGADISRTTQQRRIRHSRKKS